MRANAAANTGTLPETKRATAAVPEIASGRTARWRLPAQVAVIGTGHLVYGLFNQAFDYILYPYAVYTLGVLHGGILMTLLSMLQCALTLLVYQRMRIDWVGGSLLEFHAGSAPDSLQARILSWLTGQQRWLAFAILCALTDPFIVTAFFLGGRFGALRARDWQLFLASVLLCNAYWIFVADLIANAAVALTALLASLLQLLDGVTA